MTWNKGQSGNSRGRPPKNREFTELLSKRFNRIVALPDGQRISGKRYVIDRLHDLATSGQTQLADGRTVEVGGLGLSWFEVIKWLYAQIDGPPKSEADVNVRGAMTLNVVERLVDANSDDLAAPGAESISGK